MGFGWRDLGRLGEFFHFLGCFEFFVGWVGRFFVLGTEAGLAFRGDGVSVGLGCWASGFRVVGRRLRRWLRWSSVSMVADK